MDVKLFKILFFVFIGIKLICANEITKEEEINELCLKSCPKIMNPVCGTDGNILKLFNNPCLMQQYSCQSERDWIQMEFDSCIENDIKIGRSLCEKPCPFIYMPVCGYDGKETKIFPNECVMEVENCFSEDKFIVVKFAKCGNFIPL